MKKEKQIGVLVQIVQKVLDGNMKGTLIFAITVALNWIGANEGSRYMVYELEKEHKKSSLMCKKKEELVKEIMRLEHNVNVMNKRLNNQANAIKHYEQESRNKAIDDFMEKIDDDICNDCSKCGNGCRLFELRKIAEQLKECGVDAGSI